MTSKKNVFTNDQKKNTKIFNYVLEQIFMMKEVCENPIYE